MFRKVSGLVLVLVLSSAGVLFSPPALAHAGGGQLRPTVEWSNPSSMMYGGWPVSTSTYLYNPLGAEVKFTASMWFNGAVINTSRGVGTLWTTWPLVRSESYNCDSTGCILTYSGSIPAYGRSYIVFGMETGNSLGLNLTVGSAMVVFDDLKLIVPAEGKTNLVEGPELSVSIGLDQYSSPISGGFTPLVIRATDRTLNNFQLLGVGTDCAKAIVPDAYYLTRDQTTLAVWGLSIYVPDNVASCTVTALVRTNQTVFAAAYSVRHQS